MPKLKNTHVQGSPPSRNPDQTTVSGGVEVALSKTPFPAQLDKSRPPPARRVARLEGDRQPDSIPDGGPAWMQRAQHMANALLAALESGEATDTTQAAIERAWTAWELGGVSDRQVAKVSHLSHRAHTAIHASPQGKLEQAIADCALVLHTGLPPALRRRVSFELVVAAVRELRSEPDPWPAVVRATTRLLGWADAAQAHAAHAVRLALEERAKR